MIHKYTSEEIVKNYWTMNHALTLVLQMDWVTDKRYNQNWSKLWFKLIAYSFIVKTE